MKNILVVMPLNQTQKTRLTETFLDFKFSFTDVCSVTKQQISESSAIIGNIPAVLLSNNENIELLQLNSAGADAYVKDGIVSEKTVLANATGAYNKTVAEHALALAFSLMKNLHLYRDNQNRNNWYDEGCALSFENARVLIVGCGSIGLQFAKYTKALGAYNIGVRTKASSIPGNIDEMWSIDELDKILPTADVVVAFLPNTKETLHLFDSGFFSIMKNTAIFINCGRGSTVDSKALEHALKNNIIRAAAIDVCEEEPLSSESPLWKLNNLVITPHVAGGYHLDDTMDKIVDIAIKNLSALEKGTGFVNIVNRKTGYKQN